MNIESKRLMTALVTGLIFGLGLAISRMIDPEKVINFLDFFGTWDPSLAFVMGGGLLVNFVATKYILKLPTPVLADVFRMPAKTEIDKKLLTGSALFGIGWGLAGYCPGPALTSLSFVNMDILVLVVSYLVGTVIGKYINDHWDRRAVKAQDACVG